MGDCVKRTLEAIGRVEAQFEPGEAWKISNSIAEGYYAGSIFLSQLKETKTILHSLKSTLEGHKAVHRELYRAVLHIETSAKEWWSPGMHNGKLVLAKWREHFVEMLLDVRWWTMVTALQQTGEQTFTGSNIRDDFLLMISSGVSQLNSQSPPKSSYVRHLPSYEFEEWWPKCFPLRSCLQWNVELGNILVEDESRANMALQAVRNADFPGFAIDGMPASYVDEATSPLIEEVTVDLTRDVLLVSRTGSWVVRTKYEGVDYALKKVTDGDSEQPVIARLSHPHIVQLMHYWRKDEALFLTMELMEGDLTDLLSRHKRANGSLISLPTAVDIMLQTAKGMLYLHDLDITYPHLNCSNVLFRKSDTLQDGFVEYIIKLSEGGYSVKNDSNFRKTHDVHRFGSFCLEVLAGRQQCEDSLDIVADTRPNIPVQAIPQILKFCITSCFDGKLEFGFEQVVTLLLLAQCEVLKSQKDEAFVAFGSKDREIVNCDEQKNYEAAESMDASNEFRSNADAQTPASQYSSLPIEQDLKGSPQNKCTGEDHYNVNALHRHSEPATVTENDFAGPIQSLMGGELARQDQNSRALSRYEAQKRRDWTSFKQHLRNHTPPLSLARCTGVHVLEFVKNLDQFGKTKVHIPSCPVFGVPHPPHPCPCPLRQAWGSMDAMIGRLRAAFEENGGKPECNPFGERQVRLYLGAVRVMQEKARGIAYKKKKRKRMPSVSEGEASGAQSLQSSETTT